MKSITAVVLIGVLVFAIAVVGVELMVKAAPVKGKIVLENTTGRTWDAYHGELQNLASNLTAKGYTVVIATNGITSDVLSGAQGLIIIKPKTDENLYTDAEINAIKNWFNEGGKFLWVASDSDYIEPYLTSTKFKTDTANRILEAVGSVLRFDYCSVEDPTTNAGAPYRVVSNVTNTQNSDAAQITKGVVNALFHGPTVVAGYKNGKLVPFNEVESDNIFWIFKTTPNGVIVDNDPSSPPQAYTVGEKGSYVLMAAEKYAGPNKDCKVIVSAEGPYGDHGGFTNSYHGVTLQGTTWVLQAIDWGMTVEKKAAMPTTLIIAAVVIVAIIAVAAFMLTKKK